MATADNGLRWIGTTHLQQAWSGTNSTLAFEPTSIKACLYNLEYPCYIVREQGRIGATNEGQLINGGGPASAQGGLELLAALPPLLPQSLGDPYFRHVHGVRYSYMTGAMANAIASTNLVIAMGQAQMLGAFGAAGVVKLRLEEAIRTIQTALPNGPYAFNLIHSPNEEAMERDAVELYLQHGVHTVEASAFLALTPHVVRYRVAGLRLNQQNQIEVGNRVIAKISRREVATPFMQPAPSRMLGDLLEQGLITQQQANLAQYVPMADDITVEADSGGHTDNRPLVALLPSILALRNEIQANYGYAVPLRVGVGGGISTPQSVLAAYMMGAAYVVTGSVNQACLEAGTSDHTRNLLAQAGIADVMMAPAADMFEMGVKVQLLKKGTLFPMRAQKLYEIYAAYNSIDEIPAKEREKLERQIFQQSLEQVWSETVAFFHERDPEQITRAENNPKRKMALIFRWYLGLSSRWSNQGVTGREMDYQIWCGPAMGAFNDWVRGSYLEDPANRRVTDIAHHLMRGTAALYRVQSLRTQGLLLPPMYDVYQPVAL